MVPAWVFHFHVRLSVWLSACLGGGLKHLGSSKIFARAEAAHRTALGRRCRQRRLDQCPGLRGSRFTAATCAAQVHVRELSPQHRNWRRELANRLDPSLELGGKLPTVCGTNRTTSPSSRSRTQPRVLAMRNSTGRSHRRGPRQPEQRRRDQLAQPAKRQHLGDQARGPRREQQRPAANSQQSCCNSRPKFRPKQRPRRPHHGQGTHKCGKRSSRQRQSRCLLQL